MQVSVYMYMYELKIFTVVFKFRSFLFSPHSDWFRARDKRQDLVRFLESLQFTEEFTNRSIVLISGLITSRPVSQLSPQVTEY